MSSKTLYTFTGSVWAAAAELAVAELGYKEDDISVKSVNLSGVIAARRCPTHGI
ncbi:hypothetical protein FB45DRAFT_1027861 [Roridomyces roridus]|uniref:Uncharacterized protein n=1 Tax=Roridomyces roridus TaxID=1738132 RepID=A0AAD7BTV7_9AGAR|nr:hypothetical protein FB45DRAFT_1027861 [Roridomyces roridus]